MTVNYTTNLALGQPVTGTESGTWGDDVNNSITAYLDIAIAGGLAVSITTADVTLSLTQGTSSATNIGSTTAQYAILNISGAMTAARSLILPSSSRHYIINNNTTGGFALTVKGSATTGVTMVNGESSHIYWNGSDYAKLSNAPGGTGSFSGINELLKLTATTGTAAAYQTITNTGGNFYIGRDNAVGSNFSAGAYASVLFSAGAYPMAFFTDSAERMRIDSSGNVGIGVTPTNNFDIYKSTALVTRQYSNTSVQAVLANYSADTVGPQQQFYKYRGSPTTPAIVSSGDITGRVQFYGYDGATLYPTAEIRSNVDGTPGVGDMPGRLVFFTTPDGSSTVTERMRIDNSGKVLIGLTSATTAGLTQIRHTSPALSTSVSGTSVQSTPAIQVSKPDATNTTSQIFAQFYVADYATGSGQINANGAGALAFGSFSDQRLKENITDLPPQLSNIMALRPVEFDYIESMGGGHQVGFIAQEVQAVYPDIVGESEDGMLTLTDMNKNDARLIKCIQEQQALILSLTARIEALEAK